MSPPVVVLGAGPCGLAAAWELSATGRQCVVLEREDRVGGLAATHERDGWRFDLGGHRFLTADRALNDGVVALMGDDFLTAERKSSVLLDGRRFRYPLEAADLVRNLGLGANARALVGYLIERARSRFAGRDESSFEGWMVSRFGRPLYDLFFGPYTEKLWGMPPSELSSDWAAQRISLLNLGDVALRLAGIRRSDTRTYARRYLYPRHGIGQLFERIACAVGDSGCGEVRVGAEVIGLEVGKAGVDAVVYRQDGREVRQPASGVVCTAPLPKLASWLGARGPAARAGAKLRHRAVRFFNILLDRTDVGADTWLYVADRSTPIARIQEPRRRSPEMAPAGKTSLMLELPCDVDDELWSAPDANLADRLLGDLARLGISVGHCVAGFFSTRVVHGYPVYHLGYNADREAVLAEAARVPNLVVAGRQGLHRYLFMDIAMCMGREAARQLCRREVAPARIAAFDRQSFVTETAAITAA